MLNDQCSSEKKKITNKMLPHLSLGKTEISRKKRIRRLIKEGKITMAGNIRLKIYGTLSCKSGKLMKSKNRVFFSSEEEAISLGYRPCGHCMRKRYVHLKIEN